MKNRITAAILALFLGGIGAHKFYLDRPRPGVVYLLFCWTFIPALIGVVEFFVLISQSNQEFNSRYNEHFKPPSVVSASQTIDEQLELLRDLKERGVITEAEFEARKEMLGVH